MYDPNRIPLTPQQQIDQTTVRPWLKGVAAILLVLLGAIFAFSSVKLFSAASFSVAACTEAKATSQLLCKLGNLVLTQIPAQHRGAYEGVLYLLVAAAFIFAAFLMLRSPRK
ncbi:hypothetical protein [Polaromonas sp. A23]|uniref:hypothetical protein n=1 Tax=Polaromonas sp. A23 TaxID=1944133 RepID=UPI000987375D|nr:hypothetical protein [Polaromonas sp. A23]OOG38790.1 hypothetical protein B0B52_16385 [Polaromonas sp. A23]